ncbi:APC5 protein, partial [Oxylabes madagascariensis]|nr:APC5 protein [Oxylabes madagascariensis]
QASLLKNDETKALAPASLQKELNNLLKFNPDFAEAVSVVRLTVLKTRMHCRVLGGKHRPINQRSECIMHNSDQYSSGSGCCILSTVGILIVLPLCAHSQQAELALQEAIRIAQESNDHVCLQHCLSWLYILEQKIFDSCVLLEHSVNKSLHFGLP